MYIPRPAKLLITIDDGWNKFLEKQGENVSSWTRLSIERMLACGTCSMGADDIVALRLIVLTAVFLPELQVKSLQFMWFQRHRAVVSTAGSYFT